MRVARLDKSYLPARHTDWTTRLYCSSMNLECSDVVTQLSFYILLDINLILTIKHNKHSTSKCHITALIDNKFKNIPFILFFTVNITHNKPANTKKVLTKRWEPFYGFLQHGLRRLLKGPLLLPSLSTLWYEMQYVSLAPAQKKATWHPMPASADP